MPCIRSSLMTLARNMFLGKPKEDEEKKLEERLKAAERVNSPPRVDYTDYTDRASDQVHHLLDRVIGDGLWRCCRGHEQELIHYKGPHPFKRLTCYRCQHILCPQCCTTDVLTLLEHQQQLYASPSTTGPLPFGQVCPNCGLSHRARTSDDVTTSHASVRELHFRNIMCICGHLADETWLKFRVGPIYQYRRNPHEAFADLSRKRADSSVRRQMDGVEYN